MSEHTLPGKSISHDPIFKLRKVLVFNALFSVLCAIDMLLFSELIAEFMGFNQPIILLLIAPGLIVFGVYVYWLSRNIPNRKHVESVIWMDRIWVMGSILLLIISHSAFSYAGITLVATITVIVAAFAETQNKYQRQIQS